MKRKAGVLGFALALLFASSSRSATIVLCSLSEMIKESEFVVMGEVKEVLTTSDYEFMPPPVQDRRVYYSKARLLPLKFYKGSSAKVPIDVYFLQGLTDEPEFMVGDIGIWFLRHHNGRIQVNRGYSGKVRLQNGAADPVMIEGETSRQSASTFIKRIEEIIEKQPNQAL